MSLKVSLKIILRVISKASCFGGVICQNLHMLKLCSMQSEASIHIKNNKFEAVNKLINIFLQQYNSQGNIG